MRTTIANHGHRCATLGAALSAGLAWLLLASATAHANTGAFTPAPSATPSTIAGCNQLPWRERGFCRSQVGWSQVTASRVAIDQQASAATASQMAGCKSLPLSDLFVCEDQAGYGEKVPRGLAQNQHMALENPQARYKTAVAACHRMPISDWTTCESQAGYDARLAGLG